MIIIGDVHGQISELKKLISESEVTFQLGDLGVGFVDPKELVFPDTFSFIRGNHDSPSLCRNHKNYAGDYGFYHSIGTFFVSGAWSIDSKNRTENVDWWRDEELGYIQQNKALELYETCLPDIMLTHDCPNFIFDFTTPTSTSMFLETLYEIHQPSFWIFGHHHRVMDVKIGKTRFVCLPELEWMKI